MENRKYNPKLKPKEKPGSKQKSSDEEGSSSDHSGVAMQKPEFLSAQQERLKRMKRRMEMKQNEEQMAKEQESRKRAKRSELPCTISTSSSNDKEINSAEIPIPKQSPNVQVPSARPRGVPCLVWNGFTKENGIMLDNLLKDVDIVLKPETVTTTMEEVQLNKDDDTCSSSVIETQKELAKPVETGKISGAEDSTLVPADENAHSVLESADATAQREFAEIPIDLPNTGENSHNSTQDSSPVTPPEYFMPLGEEPMNLPNTHLATAEAQTGFPKTIESEYSSTDEPAAAKKTGDDLEYKYEYRPAPVVYCLRTAGDSESDSSSSDESSTQDEPVRKSTLLPPMPEGFNFDKLSPTSQFIMTISQYPSVSTTTSGTDQKLDPPAVSTAIATATPENESETEADADSDAMEIDESVEPPLQDEAMETDENETIESSNLPSRNELDQQYERDLKRAAKKRSPTEKKKKQKLLTDLQSVRCEDSKIQWDVDSENKYVTYIRNVIFDPNEQKIMWTRLQKFQVWTIDPPMSLHVPGGACCLLGPKRTECQVIRRAKRCFLSRVRVIYKWIYPHMARHERKLRQTLDEMWKEMPVKHKETIYFDKCRLFYHKVISILIKYPPGPFESDIFKSYFPKGVPTARTHSISTVNILTDVQNSMPNPGAEAFEPDFAGFPGVPAQTHWTESIKENLQHFIP